MDREMFHRQLDEAYLRQQTAKKLHYRTTVVLGYNNIPLYYVPEGFCVDPILGKSSLVATNLERLLMGGVRVMVWSPGIPYWNCAGEGLAGRAKVEFLQKQLRALNEIHHPTNGLLRVARNGREIREINAAGGVAILLHLSGVSHLNDLGILREYYDLGVRMIHCGFQDYPEDSRELTQFTYTDVWNQVYWTGKLNSHGVKTIEEMKRLGIIVDVAHLKNEGFDDVASRMEGLPFVYSHGGAGALVSHEESYGRNFDDGRIARLVANRGVYGIGVAIAPSMKDRVPIDPENARKHEQAAQLREQRTQEISATAKTVDEFIRRRWSMDQWDYLEERELGRQHGYDVKPTLADLVAHIRYLRDRFGADYVGYGPDYEFNFGGHILGLEEVDKTPNLTQALLDQGFSEPEVQGVMGHNFMRVFDAILK